MVDQSQFSTQELKGLGPCEVVAIPLAAVDLPSLGTPKTPGMSRRELGPIESRAASPPNV